jgi:hypothetical protein
MDNLPALLLNATPLVSRFFAAISKKRQQCAVVNLENNFYFALLMGSLLYRKQFNNGTV